MREFFGQAVQRAFKGKTGEEIAYSVLPHFFLEIIRRYLRVETEGLEHIPKKGPAIIIANHSGFMGFDALMISHQVFNSIKRVPRIIAHKLWFIRPELSVHARKMGLIPATYENGLKIIKKKEILVLFPEGEEGNFKPTSQRYRLRQFRRGCVRLALATGAPIIPSVVIGAEETSITLSQIRWTKHLVGIIIPVPLNVLPLPARWTIRFFEPIYLKKDPKKAKDIEYVTKLTRQLRRQLQQHLSEEVKKRKHIFL